MSWDDLFNLDLDEILSVAPTSEPEPEVGKELGETELLASRTVVASILEQSASQISNVSEVTEATDLLINSLITEDQKAVLAKLPDQLPFLVSTVKSANKTEEENMKKLETRKTAIEGVNKLKAKFELAKAKKQEMEKRASAARDEVERDFTS